MQNDVFESGALRTKSFMARRIESIVELAPEVLELNVVCVGSAGSEMKVVFVCSAAPAGMNARRRKRPPEEEENIAQEGRTGASAPLPSPAHLSPQWLRFLKKTKRS